MPPFPKLLSPNKPNPNQTLHFLLPTPPNPKTQTPLFHHLRDTTSPNQTKQLHAILIVNGFLHTPTLGAQLVNTYVRLGRVQEALQLFHSLPKRNPFGWNSILKGLSDVGLFSQVIEFYHFMVKDGFFPDNFTYPFVFKACSRLGLLEEGRKVQEAMEFDGFRPNVFVQCALIDMFAKCGRLEDARKVFDGMVVRDLVSWSAIVCGTMQVGDWAEALRLFSRMRVEGFKVDSVVFATILPACGRLGEVELGLGLHCCTVRSGVESDLCVYNALIDMYCKCGYTDVGLRLFRGMGELKDVVTWCSLIAGYSQNCEFYKSIELYAEMIRSGVPPSSVTLASVLPNFAEIKLLREGKGIHCYAIKHNFESDKFVASALVDFYCQCRSIREAKFISEIIPHKDIAIWNSLIAGYASEGDADSAFTLLRKIQDKHFKPNSITVITVIPLCTRFAMLRQGKELHGYITRNGLSYAVSVTNSMIDMYCKCGSLELGQKLFELTTCKNIVTYNTIIAAVGMHGYGDKPIKCFHQMRSEGIKPDKVTFIALISACSHAGFIDQGLMFYNSMTDDYRINPDMEHFSCMVDLYGRSGYLDEALEFIKRMPIEPDIDVLGSLLAACRVHKRPDLAEYIGKLIFEKKPEDPGYYVLLANTYAAADRWTDEIKVRMMIKERGLIKNPGTSWIQVGSSVEYFTAQGRSHLVPDDLCQMLENLYFQMKDVGYIPDIDYVHCLADESCASVYATCR